MRNLVLVLGDQLNEDSAAFDGFDRQVDAVWMAEAESEATHVWCHQLRIACFLSALRHFRDKLRSRGLSVIYHELSADRGSDRGACFSELLSLTVAELKPSRLIVVEPGDWRVREELLAASRSLGVRLEVREDRHFYCSTTDFGHWAANRKNLVLEFFYRWMRKQHGILMTPDGQPVGGQWNFDRDNRESFGRDGPSGLTAPLRFGHDAITLEVVELVRRRYASHPGSLENFNLPTTREQARAMLQHFVASTLPKFGAFEDAMWTDEAFLFHSRLSMPLNLKLLNPRECVDAAVQAWSRGDAPLNSVEGFVRQILGWREFVRGIYWQQMPEYAERNHLEHAAAVPSFFWDGETDMECVRQSMQHVLSHGYSHHIHRLMVLGNLSLLLGVHPLKFHEWHMAMYLDAIDWVSLPDTLGMSQFGDGGIVGTKPYCSSGNYINQMSPFCKSCRFDYRKRSGVDACPFTTLYWDFFDRHFSRLRDNPRLKFAIRNLEKRRQNQGEMKAIREHADRLKRSFCEEPE